MTSTAGPYGVCAMGAHNGHFYKIITYTQGQATWTHAKNHAKNMDKIVCENGNEKKGYLASIRNIGESNFVTNLLTNDDCSDLDAWIGLREQQGSGEDATWEWVKPNNVEDSAEEGSFSNWCVGQPDQNSETVGEIWLSSKASDFGCWNDNEKNTNGNQNGADNDKYVLEYNCIPSSFGAGDPHFETWNAHMYDFQGECDLTLVNAPSFAVGIPMKIDVRTTIRYSYSYIETAAIQIGNDILEITGYGEYFFNGVGGADLPATMGGDLVSVTHEQVNKKLHFYELTVDENTKIVVKTHKDLVSVKIAKGDPARFADSHGLLGDYENGKMSSRNGTVVFEDGDAYAQEWQVREGEPILFQTAREPQHPRVCVLPSQKTTSTQRRLGENTVSLDAAMAACAKWAEDTRDACIHDVMGTGDLELAAAGAF